MWKTTESLVENYLQLLAIPAVVECFRPNVPRETIQEIYQLSRQEAAFRVSSVEQNVERRIIS